MAWEKWVGETIMMATILEMDLFQTILSTWRHGA